VVAGLSGCQITLPGDFKMSDYGVHSMDGQSVAVLAIVAVAAAILLRRVFSLKRHASGCGMGCSGCSKSGRHEAAVPLVQLGTPSF